MKTAIVLLALVAGVFMPTVSWSAGPVTQGSCSNTKTKGVRCSDGSLASGGSRIRVGVASPDNKSVDSDSPIPGIRLLTLYAKIPVPTCVGRFNPISTAYKIGNGPVVVNNNSSLKCEVKAVPDTDIVTLPAAADCSKIAPVLAYRKWRSYEKLNFNAVVDWTCD